MNKLQKYNQIILALVGTGMLVAGIFFIGLFFFYELARNTGPQHEILEEEQLAADREAGIRRQKATFTPIILSHATAKNWQWSPIEVGVKTLKNPEQRQPQLSRMVDASRYSSYRVSDVTNLIIWNKNTTESRLVFENRVDIEAVVYIGDLEFEYMLIIARPTASDRSGLYHYSVADNHLSNIAVDDGLLVHDFLNAYSNNAKATTLVALAIDQDGNGKFDGRQEITVPWRFDPDTKSLKPLAPNEIYEKAQSVLDGD